MNEQQKKIKKQLSRIINNLPIHYYYGVVRRWSDEFGGPLCLEVLQRIPAGKPLSYIYRALQKEYFKTKEQTNEQILDLAERYTA